MVKRPVYEKSVKKLNRAKGGIRKNRRGRTSPVERAYMKGYNAAKRSKR